MKFSTSLLLGFATIGGLAICSSAHPAEPPLTHYGGIVPPKVKSANTLVRNNTTTQQRNYIRFKHAFNAYAPSKIIYSYIIEAL